MSKEVIIIGAGGHAKVIADIIIKSGDTLIGFLDDNKRENVLGYPVLGRISDIEMYSKKLYFILGIGSNVVRKQIDSIYNMRWYKAIHPTACIGIGVNIKEGTTVMANAVINTSTNIGRHCIINTGSIIEHDNVIEDFVHISPSASLGGTVRIGELSWIGIGASVINNITITDGCIVGAGTVVIKDINEPGIYVGVPATRLKSEE